MVFLYREDTFPNLVSNCRKDSRETCRSRRRDNTRRDFIPFRVRGQKIESQSPEEKKTNVILLVHHFTETFILNEMNTNLCRYFSYELAEYPVAETNFDTIIT